MFLTQFSVTDFSFKTYDKSPIGPMEAYMSSLPGVEADSESPGEDNTSEKEISKGNRNNEDENSLHGGKSSLGTDESETKHDTADEDKKGSSNGHRPRLKDNERPPAAGTSSKMHSLKRGKHFKIKSTELRWNVARDFGTQIEDKRRIRVKRKRKAGSEQRTEKHQTDDSRHDPDESSSPIIVAAVCAGMLALLCMLTGLVRLWYVFHSCFCL